MYRIIIANLFFLFVFSNILYSQVPQLINYQGKITDDDGLYNGTVEITFTIYDSETGSSSAWNESHPEVNIVNGLFNVLLGSITPFPDDLFSGSENRYLGIRVGSQELSPRSRITSVAYSLQSGSTSKLQGREISDSNPQQGQVLKWDGASWKPDTDNTTEDIGTGDITSVVAGEGLRDGGDAGDVTLNVGEGNGISVSADAIGLDETYTDSRYVNEGQNNSITTGMITPSIISSIDGLENDGGNIDLIAGSNVTITPDAANKSITISSVNGGTGGGGDITKVTAGSGLTGGGDVADVTLNVGQGNGITVDQDAVSLNTTYTDGRYVLEGQTNSITSDMVAAGAIGLSDLSDNSVNNNKIVDNSITTADISPNIVSSIDGVSNDGGNIDLIAGSNVTITPNNSNNSITIASASITDNLGNHSATQNIRLNNYWLSGDGGNEGIYVNNIGNIGIGTNNPEVDLHVKGWIRQEGSDFYMSEPSRGDGGRALVHAGTNSNDDRLVLNFAGDFEQGVQVQGSKMTVDGNIGIRTSNPQSVLSIGGDGSSNYSLFCVNDGTTGGSSAVYGFASDASNISNYGGYFRANGQNGRGVYGTGVKLGMFGVSDGEGGRGVEGHALETNGIGIYGYGSHYAGYFYGDVNITGNISKGSGSFLIDHPLDPQNKKLYHSFIESPDMMNIYNGNITTDIEGNATVELPEWFEALNRDFRYQLTVIGEFAQAIVSKKIENNKFMIKTDSPNIEVSWQVTGIRQDAYANANRIPVEEYKKPENRGKYIHPEAFNLSIENGINIPAVR